ncbi:hypothetical protein CsSME_00010202 [Camellia sinensis var. sinensis]
MEIPLLSRFVCSLQINFHPKVDHIAERALIDHILHDRRLNNNTLSGTIPMSLTTISSLQSLFVAGNIIFHTIFKIIILHFLQLHRHPHLLLQEAWIRDTAIMGIRRYTKI